MSLIKCVRNRPTAAVGSQAPGPQTLGYQGVGLLNKQDQIDEGSPLGQGFPINKNRLKAKAAGFQGVHTIFSPFRLIFVS